MTTKEDVFFVTVFTFFIAAQRHLSHLCAKVCEFIGNLAHAFWVVGKHILYRFSCEYQRALHITKVPLTRSQIPMSMKKIVYWKNSKK
jgi:hypothetical protein